MKPPKFHVGQAVVCVDEWEDKCQYGKAVLPGQCPKPGPIYYVEGSSLDDGTWFITVKGIPDYEWDEDGFAPVELLPDEALAELLSETLEPVTA